MAVFGPKEEEVKGDYRKVHSKEFHMHLGRRRRKKKETREKRIVRSFIGIWAEGGGSKRRLQKSA